MAGNYGWNPGGYDPYNPGMSYGYPGLYNPSRYLPNNNMGVSQPVAPPPTQVPQNVQQNSNVPWIQVPNIEAARNVMVNPNQTAYMMNQNAPEFYVKSTDTMGVATLRCFKFFEFDPTEEAAKEVINSQASNLVSREEFNNFASNVAAQFNAIQQGMNAGHVNTQVVQQPPVMVPQSSPQAVVPVQHQEVVAPKKETTTKKKEVST